MMTSNLTSRECTKNSQESFSSKIGNFLLFISTWKANLSFWKKTLENINEPTSVVGHESGRSFSFHLSIFILHTLSWMGFYFSEWKATKNHMGARKYFKYFVNLELFLLSLYINKLFRKHFTVLCILGNYIWITHKKWDPQVNSLEIFSLFNLWQRLSWIN